LFERLSDGQLAHLAESLEALVAAADELPTTVDAGQLAP